MLHRCVHRGLLSLRRATQSSTEQQRCASTAFHPVFDFKESGDMLAFSATNQQLQQQQHVEMPNVIAEHPLKELEEKQDILKFFGVSSDRDFPEGLPKQFQKVIDTVGERHWMLRRKTAELIKELSDAETRQPGYILSGPSGTGKSVALAQIVEYCRSNDWLVMYIPKGRSFAYDAPAVTESLMYPGQFDIEEPAVELLKAFAQSNGDALANLTLAKQYNTFFEPLELVFDGQTMHELVQFGIENPEAACAVAVELLFELRHVSSVPVLVAIDEFNWLYFDTVFGFGGKRIAPHDISLIRALKPYNRTGFRRKAFANGAFVCAYTEHYPTKFDAKDEVLCSKKQLKKFKAYSRQEMESVMTYYNQIQFSFEPVTADTSNFMSFMTARIPHKVFKRILAL